jgi:hypothetical protein
LALTAGPLSSKLSESPKVSSPTVSSSSRSSSASKSCSSWDSPSSYWRKKEPGPSRKTVAGP